MANEFEGEKSRRRYPRATGPFEGFLDQQPVLIYDLNVGGGFINSEQQPADGSTVTVTINLGEDGTITVMGEALYRHAHGFAVRFSDLDADTTARITRTVNAFATRRPWF